MAVKENNRKLFIEALLRNVRTDDERKVLSGLISSSMAPMFQDDMSVIMHVGRPLAKRNKWMHSPQMVNAFLRKFSTHNDLKFAVHTWDHGHFTSYRNFIERIESVLKSDDTYKSMYHYNVGLNYSLRNFLQINTETSFSSWAGDYTINVGLRYPEAEIQKWMDANPGKDIMALPLDELPEFYRPKIKYNTKTLANMEDVCDLFKHIIEFRDKDFERMIKNAFKSSDYVPSIDESIKGISFYTYTPAVKDALHKIASNIRERIVGGASQDVRVFVKRIDNNILELHVNHVGSYADCEISKSKLEEGTIANMRLHKNQQRSSLLSICDYSVRSRFISDDGNKEFYEISYLYPGVEGDEVPEVQKKKISEGVDGFEYILRFYK
jgi:hypothetical protein